MHMDYLNDLLIWRRVYMGRERESDHILDQYEKFVPGVLDKIWNMDTHTSYFLFTFQINS